MGDLIRRFMIVLATIIVVTLALSWTGAHPGSMRFSVVTKISAVAATFYSFSVSERLTSSGFWVEARVDNPERSPIIFLFLSVVLAMIAVACFFGLGNDA